MATDADPESPFHVRAKRHVNPVRRFDHCTPRTPIVGHQRRTGRRLRLTEDLDT